MRTHSQPGCSVFPAGVCSLFGNSTLLYVSYKKKHLLKPAEYFIINLAVSDLGLTLSLYPMAITSSFYHRYECREMQTKWLLSPPENGILWCEAHDFREFIGIAFISDSLHISWFIWLYDWLAVQLPVSSQIWSVMLMLFFSFPFLTFSLIDLPFPPSNIALYFSFSHSFGLLRRWLYGKTVCSIYAFCGMLFGICSLTTLTLLSMVCFVKVCYPLYGKSPQTHTFLPNDMT